MRGEEGLNTKDGTDVSVVTLHLRDPADLAGVPETDSRSTLAEPPETVTFVVISIHLNVTRMAKVNPVVLPPKISAGAIGGFEFSGLLAMRTLARRRIGFAEPLMNSRVTNVVAPPQGMSLAPKALANNATTFRTASLLPNCLLLLDLPVFPGEEVESAHFAGGLSMGDGWRWAHK